MTEDLGFKLCGPVPGLRVELRGASPGFRV